MSEIFIFIVGVVFGAGITITAFAFALDVLNSKHKKGEED